MRKIEWTWVKGHSGYLLNECAGLLATKGVNNETPYSNAQYLHPINEDTDSETYIIRDGEGDEKPQCTYVMKDGGNLQEYLSRDPTPYSTPEPSAAVSVPVSDVPDQSEIEDDEPQWPQPQEDPDGRTARVCSFSEPRPHQGTRPDSWSPAWETLNGCLMRVDSPLLPVPPKDFKEAVQTDVWMVDQIGTQSRTVPVTGLEVGPESVPSLFSVVTGCVWNTQYATLIKYGKEGESPNTMILEQLALAVSLIPAGKDMRYDTILTGSLNSGMT
jgi:hypothetical protein